jgi:hypothetical protein
LRSPLFSRPLRRAARLVYLAAICAAASLEFALPTEAAVRRLVIKERVPLGNQPFGKSGQYEKLTGRLELEVDPDVAANAAVIDLKRAPRNAQGRVSFATDFFLLKPVDLGRGNHRLLYEVNNRGNKLMLGAFNDRGGNNPSSTADAGNGFLMRQGYTVLWCGWNGDVAPGNNKLLIDLPIAAEHGQPITGPIYAEICVDTKSSSQPFYWGGSNPYPAVSLDNANARLTRRLTRRDPAVEIPRDRWRFAHVEGEKIVPDPKRLYLKDGFEPGWLYELVYVGRDPRVTGLGLAAVRDVISFFRYEKADAQGTLNPLYSETQQAAGVERAYGFGISQSARFLHHFLYEGFNADERGRAVFDGIFAHVGGGGRGLFNARFAQTTRHGSPHEDNLYPSDTFPFTSTQSRDPVTGEIGDIFEHARKVAPLPKIFFTETSTEYWCRAASLLHTTPDGAADVPLDPNVRLYFIAGGQHGVSASPTRGLDQNPRNILDYRPILRALLVALDQWVSEGKEPPPSSYPRLADKTLVTIETYRATFPKIPGVNLPLAPYAPLRLDLGPRWKTERIADQIPPRIGAAYVTLVPAVGPDGNELVGIHLPDIAVPIATFTGWNLRGPKAGAEGEVTRLNGSYLPFARSARERATMRDLRPAVTERYPTPEAYVSKVRATAEELRKKNLLLDEDVQAIVERASRQAIWPQAKN